MAVVPPPAGLATSGDVTLQDTYSFLKLNKLVASSRAHSRNYHNWKRTPVYVSHLSSTTGREGVRFHVVRPEKAGGDRGHKGKHGPPECRRKAFMH